MVIFSILFLLLSNAVTLRRDKSILFSRVTITILLYSSLLAIGSLYLTYLDTGIGLYGGLFHATSTTQIFHIFIFLISAAILQLTGFYPRKVWVADYSSINKILFYNFLYYRTKITNKMGEQFKIIEYPLILLFIITGAVFLVSTSDLVSIFLSIELQSYGLYLLSTLYRNSELATNGGLTYFLLGGLSSCFILLGTALLYANSGTTNLDGIYVITSLSDLTSSTATLQGGGDSSLAQLSESSNILYWYKPYYINFSLLILSVGFLFKVSAAPFHFWSPDVYDAIPTIVTTFVAIVAKISIFVFFLELVHYTSNSLFESTFSWTSSLLVSSLLSLITGTVVGLTQFRIKRLFAYSTISHVGFILLALSINSIESIQAFIFYLMQYSISNLNAFIILISIGYSLYYYVNDNREYKQLLDKNNSPAMRSGKPLLWVLWPNSGNLLKLLVPSYSWKAISGWANHSCTVISQNMIEREMEYRGSKSDNISVKEQRVDGHRCVNLTHLRYALMGFERNYLIRIPSNHLNTLRRSYTSLVFGGGRRSRPLPKTCLRPPQRSWGARKLATNQLCNLSENLNPLFLTGFSDGESNFTVRIVKSNSVKVGWVVQPVFQIGLHKKDLNLLEKFQSFWGVGVIYHKEESSNYMVQSLRGLNVIVNHFERYPLLTKKCEDFKLFAQIMTLINKKEHLTLSGLHEIISLKASMNLGLPTSLKTAFPDVTPAIRPKRLDEELSNSKIDPYWMVGFTAGEGCFSIKITKSSTVKTGFQVQLRFNITQHSIDKVFMNSLTNFWGCGKVFLRFRENKVDFKILKIKDLSDKVVPLFQSISLQGVKSKDFADFCKAVEIMRIKRHLTKEGLDELNKLKVGMNTGRK